jgi:hypothetical protein
MDAQPTLIRCTIVPEAFLRQIAGNEEESPEMRGVALHTLELDSKLNAGQGWLDAHPPSR